MYHMNIWKSQVSKILFITNNAITIKLIIHTLPLEQVVNPYVAKYRHAYQVQLGVCMQPRLS